MLAIQAICPSPASCNREMGSLMLLGFVSAVESYVRSLICGVISADEGARIASQKEQISFAAATHQSRSVLAEALIEHMSFSSPRRIAEALKIYAGFRKGAVERGLSNFGKEFNKACQMRHCIVHRFGRLGSQNALALGFDEYKFYVNERLDFSYATTQQVASVCDVFVRSLNNFCYDYVLRRTYHKNYVDWTSDLRKDKPKFRPYFNLFSSLAHHPTSPSLKCAYEDLRSQVFTERRKPSDW